MNHKSIFATNLKRYMALHDKSRKEVCDALGFSYFTFSDWATGKKMPRMNKVEMIANYFGVSIADLIEEKKESATELGNGLSEAKQQLLALAEQCSDEDAEKLLQMMRILLGKK